MPLLKLQTSMPIDEAQRTELAKSLSQVMAGTIGKPESYVMVALSDGPICMGGELGPAAFADVRSIGGLSGSVNKQLSDRICTVLQEKLSIAPERTFLNFTDVPRDSWGHNRTTFG